MVTTVEASALKVQDHVAPAKIAMGRIDVEAPLERKRQVLRAPMGEAKTKIQPEMQPMAEAGAASEKAVNITQKAFSFQP
jgi:hypothetical protein